LLFGGENHKTFLGCLNCSKYSADSISNRYGTYGSPYSSESIFNKYSDYGSKYSEYGICNRYANDPPVIVDQEGKYYGRLTMNKFHPEIGIGKKLIGFVTSVCEGKN
jgi:hypothetical protein